MRKLLYTLAFTVIGFTASYAQKVERKRFSAEERAEKYATSLQEKLGLTAEQKSKVKTLELDRFKAFEITRKKDSVAMKAKFEARKAEMKAHEEKLSKILNKEQQAKLSAERAAMEEKVQSRFKEHKGKYPRHMKARKDSVQRKTKI
jgi:protein CpxP